VFNDMDKWTRIRRDVLAGGMSRRQAVKKYNLNFRTIQKVLRQEEPPEHRKKSERDKPVIGRFIPIIHAIREADKKKHRKQRHTGKRIFERLRDEHEYTGGITAVRDEIRRYRQQAAEVFMPLAHPPGEAQFDFGQAQAIYRGREITVMFSVMSLPYSDAFFCQAFPRECTETFQAGHVRSFEFFGGVPKRIIDVCMANDHPSGTEPREPGLPMAALRSLAMQGSIGRSEPLQAGQRPSRKVCPPGS